MKQFVIIDEFLLHVEFLLGSTGHQLMAQDIIMTAVTLADARVAPAPEAAKDPDYEVTGSAPMGADTELAEGAAGVAPERASICMAMYNICRGCAGCLEMVLRAMNQMNLYVGILSETKMTDGIHT